MLKIADFLRQTDEMIEDAWRQRNWSRFTFLALATAVGMTVFGVVLVYAPSIIFLEATRAFHYIRLGGSPMAGMTLSAYIAFQYAGVWNFAVAFGAVCGVMALVSAVPTMVIKEFGGRIKP